MKSRQILSSVVGSAKRMCPKKGRPRITRTMAMLLHLRQMLPALISPVRCSIKEEIGIDLAATSQGRAVDEMLLVEIEVVTKTITSLNSIKLSLAVWRQDSHSVVKLAMKSWWDDQDRFRTKARTTEELLRTRAATSSSGQSHQEDLALLDHSQIEMRITKWITCITRMVSLWETSSHHTSSSMTNHSTHSKIGTKRASDSYMTSVDVRREWVATEAKSTTSYRTLTERRTNSIQSSKTWRISWKHWVFLHRSK